jgi:hypothetical protein
MNDDWRLRIDVDDPAHRRALSERLDASELEHALEKSFHDRIILSLDDDGELFAYTGTREQAEAAERLIAEVAAGHGWSLRTELRHWHPEAEEWEDPDAPLPATEADERAEHAERVAQEREETREQGYPDFEVRVQCRSHRDCVEFAERLQAEGLDVVRRYKFLVVAAADEDTANALAARFHREAPEGSEVVAEGTIPGVFQGKPMNPFAIFGGLAG